MPHRTDLLNMIFRVTALATLVAMAGGFLQATSNGHMETSLVARCALIFEVVYPEDEGEDPYPICSSHCPFKNQVWFDGVAYKRFCDLDRYNMMVEATFRNGELQGCKMVPLLTNEQLKTQQTALHATLEGCLANNTKESSNSSDLDLGPVPDKMSGFTRVGNSFYLVSPMSLSWHDGAEFCEQFGATLAIIDSEIEQRRIQEVLSSDVWIGVSDVLTEGTFTTPLLSKVNYTNWASAQPDNGNGTSENCAMMAKQLDYRWVDASCNLKRRALCEWLPGGGAPRYSCPADSNMFQRSVCFHVSGPADIGNYSQAVKYCTSRNMTLASIHSQDQETFVERLLTDSVWIGLNDNGRVGDFRWIDGSPLDYNHFPIGQPDALLGENCVEIRKDFGYHWNNWLCSMRMRFLCKRAVSVQ